MAGSYDLPSISVVIPSFNQGAYIEETLRSVLDQGYGNVEILVMDGGSTDGTLDVLKKYESRLSYWRSGTDGGQANAINDGLKRARGEIFCWLNSDDLHLPNTLSEVARRFEHRTREKRLICGACLCIYDPKDSISDRAPFIVSPEGNFDGEALRSFDFIPQPSAFWTRALWEEVGGLTENYEYVLDWDWLIRASQRVPFEPIPEVLSVMRWQLGQKTLVGGAKRRAEIRQIVEQYGSDYWASLYGKADAVLRQLNFEGRWPFENTSDVKQRILEEVAGDLRDPKDFDKVCIMYLI